MHLRPRRALGIGLGVCLLASPLLVGCAKKKPSAIVVSLSSEAPVPEELDQMEILIQRGDDTKHLGQYALDVSKNGDTRLPGTLTLQKEDGEDATSPVTITVTGASGAKKRVLRRATLGFSDEKTKLLKMPLRYSCFDFKELCSATEECVGGVCQSVSVDVETLPDYEDKLVFGTAAAKSCFDEGDTACFSGATTIEAPSTRLTDTSDGGCALALGSSARGGAGLNVGLRWNASGSLGRFSTLEREAGRLSEGFSHDDAGNIQLPKGLCAAIKDGRVTAVRFSTSCATKAETQPLCVFQDTVCKVEKKASTLATSACFQCMYAPSSPKNCAALLDEARCDDASRAYLSCLLDTSFSNFSKSAECPEPRRQACASQLGDCATSLSTAACQQKLSKLLAYVACADEVNGGLADDTEGDLQAALARCVEPCTKEGFAKSCAQPSGPCGAATTEKTLFCVGQALVTCDPTTKQATGTQACPGGCGTMATNVNDACVLLTPMCGDGFVDTNETCDDKNKSNGDGCSTSCVVEPDYLCKGNPSACSQPSDACGACAAQTACAQVACSAEPCPTCMFQFFSGKALDPACSTNTQFLIFKSCVCGAACFAPCMTSCP